MEPSARIRRPEPGRTDPIRSMSGIWAPPGRTAQPGAAPPIADAIRGGVDLGYRVIDEYLRQGMNTARAFSGRSGPDAASGNLQDMFGQMIRMSSELSSAWLSMLMGGMNGMNGMGAMGTGAGFGAPPPPPPPDRTAPRAAPAAARPPEAAAQPEPGSAHVAVDVSSRRPVEVTLDLRSRAAGALLVHDLRSSEPTLPRLREVALVQGEDDEPLRLRIAVPDDHPAGTYSGAIVDAKTSLPRGTICVRISDPP